MPDIAEVIVRGDEPDGLGLGPEKRRKHLPVR